MVRNARMPEQGEVDKAEGGDPVSSFSKNLRSLLSWRFWVAALVAAVACGALGAFFTLILKGAEHLAFGFSTGSFAEAITKIPAHHRFFTVCVAGLLVALAWYLLRRFGPPVPSVGQLYRGKKIRYGWMAADTTLQVLNVAFGGSIGREGAPRQAGALAVADAASFLGLSEAQCRVLTACAAGAALAALYNVPVGGTFFALEVVIGFGALWAAKRTGLLIVVIALAISLAATLIARVVVPAGAAYGVPPQTEAFNLLGVALLIGPLVGAAGYFFGLAVERTAARAPQGRQILWTMPVCYLLLAALAVPFPLILGNGHALAENLIHNQVPLIMAALLIFAKPVATLLTVRAGATGGKLTPSLSTGAVIGTVIAAGCSALFPVHAGMVAVLGACAFLAGAMRAPITAGVLVIEMTGVGPSVWPLVALAVAGSKAAELALSHWKGKPR